MSIKNEKISKTGSLKGYKVSAYWKKNKKYAKIIVATAVGLLVPLNPALKVIVIPVTHLIISGIDFYLSDVGFQK